jgi:type I restriction enzyme R subunit
MSRDFLNPEQPVIKHGRRLPHWQQGETFQFVTFRLADSLPQQKILHWQKQSMEWRRTWPPPWTPDQEKEYHRRFSMKLEKWLDQGSGSCLFRNPQHREILATTLMRFHGERVEHDAWVIMPNHVHLLFKPLEPIDRLIQAWKSISSRKIAKGPIWQANYRDTLLRDSEHFSNAVRYIRANPSKAKLKAHEFTLWQSDRAIAVK